jgi:hypothetical protein
VARGTDLEALVLEMLGHPDGLCHGCGGHMHLFDPERLAASSGIVGAAAGTACGFALAHQRQRTGNVAVAFLGDSAANQGMVLEAWVVWKAARRAVTRARKSRGPSFLLVRVTRPRGHFEDDPLVRIARNPRLLWRESRELVSEAFAPHGAGDAVAPGTEGIWERMVGLADIARTMLTMTYEQRRSGHDPLEATMRRLGSDVAATIRSDVERQVGDAVAFALKHAGVSL